MSIVKKIFGYVEHQMTFLIVDKIFYDFANFGGSVKVLTLKIVMKVFKSLTVN